MVQSCRSIVINLYMVTGYTEGVRTLTVIVLLLAIFGASTQCVADCLTQPGIPPCHHHSQKKGSCEHGQFVAVAQAASDQPAVPVTHLTQAADPSEAPLNLPVRLLTILRI